MRSTKRPLFLAVGGLCAILAVVVAAELIVPISDVPASLEGGPGGDAAAGGDPASGDADTLVASILSRPLFAPDRRGPPAPKQASQATAADRAMPEIKGRLGGITIGPGSDKQAVFQRGDGEKPLVVKEGDDVDGWTVSSIDPNKVVLTSTFGEKTVEPTFGAAADAVARPKPAAKDSSFAANPQMPAPGPNRALQQQRNFNPAAPSPPGPNPRARRPSPIPTARRNDGG